MKSSKLMIAALSMIALCAGFASCSDDDDEAWWNKAGSKIQMTNTRAFILNEGSMSKNNAGITYFDWKADTTYNADLFMTQNSIAMGDVGQDIIVSKSGNMFVILSNSKVIYKLNSAGVRIAYMSIPAELGDPRYGVEVGNYLYVTCYGGFVAKIDTEKMEVVGSVPVGANPEYIIEKDGIVYCTCSGWGKDQRVAAIDTKTFGEAQYFEVMVNPDRIIEVNGHIFVQGYGAYYDYPWGELNVKDGTFNTLGNASAWTSFGSKLYYAYSATDWTTYATTTTFYIYDTNTTVMTEMDNIPEDLRSKSVYGMNVNPYTGDLYVMTTNFTTNGEVYHFKADGSYVGKIASTGINPRKIVFFN